jgi:hypothetical protein
MKSRIAVSICSLFLLACTTTGNPANSSKKYFDFDGFFKKQAVRLQSRNPLVNKTATTNSETESKRLQIDNWEKELELFWKADINKPAWKESYQISLIGSTISYLAIDSALKTRKITIEQDSNGKPSHIYILNEVSNKLYSSIEELDYFHDSLYSIKKTQKILFLDESNYLIRGSIQ